MLFRCHFVTNLTIADHNCSLENAKVPCCCTKGRTPGWLREAPRSPSSPSTLTKPSQVVCSGCCSEDSPLSLDVLFPDESWRLHVCFPSVLKGHIHLRTQGERGHGIWKYVGHSVQRYFETKCPFGMYRQAWVVFLLTYLFTFFSKKGALHFWSVCLSVYPGFRDTEKQ